MDSSRTLPRPSAAANLMRTITSPRAASIAAVLLLTVMWLCIPWQMAMADDAAQQGPNIAESHVPTTMFVSALVGCASLVWFIAKRDAERSRKDERTAAKADMAAERASHAAQRADAAVQRADAAVHKANEALARLDGMATMVRAVSERQDSLLHDLERIKEDKA